MKNYSEFNYIHIDKPEKNRTNTIRFFLDDHTTMPGGHIVLEIPLSSEKVKFDEKHYDSRVEAYTYHDSYPDWLQKIADKHFA